ncbi:MAG: glycogen debranching enzyme family protein [Bacteroidaceae bacterium]|nr:glycogen debranching enzyme family protein [Bacteroidaceae bacterium]
MGYLRFEKPLMINLEESLPREILRTNRSGAYHCSTIVDCNTRKYHGLLVLPVPNLDDENHVLLSSLDETVVQHGAEFNLGLHKYQGNVFSPMGHKYIREFTWERVPTTIYRVGGVKLKKEKAFVHHENRILIRYTLLEATSPILLRLRPFLAFRSVRQYTHENWQADKSYQLVDNGVKTCMYPGYPELFMQLNRKNEFVYRPDWYRGMEYPKERERGYEFTEDLYVPGYFEVPMKKGDVIVFSGGVSEAKSNQFKQMFQHEYDVRPPRDTFHNSLVIAAHQFHNVQGNKHYILAGYPWFKCRARDMFISLPGLTLSTGELDQFHSAMQTASEAINDFIDGNPSECKIYEIEQPDVLLWAMWTLQQYAAKTSLQECWERYGELMTKIMHFLRHSKHPNLFVHENGLVYTNGVEKSVTWMNSTANGRPVVPRTGYIVEFNALWYNALMFAASVFEEVGKPGSAEKCSSLAQLCGSSFARVFLNEYSYLFDYVDKGSAPDYSVRPNMIFAVALDYSPLTQTQKKAVLDLTTRELLTPRGLRSLSPKSFGYNPVYQGVQSLRDYAYHQGTAWPWLGGFYMEAYLKIYKRSGVSFVERQLVGYEDVMQTHCIGTISEMFDGNPPFRGRGAVAFAMNVAEVLRAVDNLKKYNQI